MNKYVITKVGVRMVSFQFSLHLGVKWFNLTCLLGIIEHGFDTEVRKSMVSWSSSFSFLLFFSPKSKILSINSNSLIWPTRGCAAGQGMVFVLPVLNRIYIVWHKSVLNRVYNFVQVCPKQCAWFVRVCSNYNQGVSCMIDFVLVQMFADI